MAKTWLIRILINECYTLLRKKQKLRRELGEDGDENNEKRRGKKV